MEKILFKDLKFKNQWQYENSETRCHYKSGLIHGKVFYSDVAGKINLSDAQKLDEVLDITFAEGSFKDCSYIRILDFSNLKEVTFKVRQYYIRTVKRLNQKYNCNPTVTYICTANHWIKATLLFAEKFLNQKFISVSNVDEAFNRINKIRSQSDTLVNETIKTEETVTISKDEIDKIVHLTGSAVWGATDNLIEQYKIPDDSPLNQLYQAIKIMISDKEEILNSEKSILEEKNDSLLQQKLLADVSFEFTKLGKIEDKINKAIRLVGEFIKVSRVYIFEDYNGGEVTKNTYEWCNSNIKPEKEGLQELPYNSIPSWKKILDENGKLFSKNILELPQDLIDILEPMGIKSILVFPIFIKKQFFGFIGFDECESDRKWDSSEVELLKTIANIISTVFEQREAESIIVESEEQHRNIIESTTEGCWVINPDKVTIDVNKSMCNMLGYTRDEMIGEETFSFIDEKDLGFYKSQAGKISETNNRRYEINLKSKSNEIVPVIINATTLFDKEGKILKAFAFVTDISERKKAQLLIAKNEERLNLAMEVANDGIWDWDLKESKVIYDDRYFTMGGYEPGEFTSHFEEWKKRIHPDDFSMVKDAVDNYLAGNAPRYETEFRFLKKDGSYMWILEKGKTITRDKDGNPSRFVGTRSDVTERRKIENELKENEEKFKAISNSANDGIILMDNLGNVSYWNKAAEKIFGYTEDEIIGKNLHELLTPQKYRDIQNKAFARFRDTGKGGALGKTLELEAIRKNGEIFLVELSLSPLKINGLWNAVGMVKDITERKRAEHALQESKNLYKNVFDNSPLGIIHYNSTSIITDCNNKFARIIGITREELVGINLVEVLQNKKLKEAIEDTLKKGSGYYEGDYSSMAVHKITPIVCHFEAIYNVNKNVIGAVGLVEDITERKKAEKKLKESEGLLRQIAENYPNSYISIIDKNFTVTFASGQSFQVMDIASESFIGLTLDEIFLDKVNFVKEQYKKAFNGTEVSFELSINNKYQYHRVVPLQFEDDSISSIFAVVEDITHRKQAEQALKESREQYSSLLENLNDIVFEIDLDSKILFVNPIAEKIIEKPHDEIIATLFHEFYDRKSQLKIYKAYKNLFDKQKNGKVIKNDDVKLELRLTNGKIVFVRTTPIIGEKGEIIGHRGIGREITEQKRAELALLESEEKYRILFEKSDDAVLVLDDGEFIDCNQSMVDILGYKSKEEVMNKKPSDFAPQKQMGDNLSIQKSERMLEIVSKEGFNHFETMHVRANGEEFPTEVWLTAIPYQGRKIIHIVWRDITERKKDEDLLRIKTKELEMFNQTMLNREMRMIELKEEVNKLSKKLKQEPPYPTIWNEGGETVGD